jgi:hypothetical protein
LLFSDAYNKARQHILSGKSYEHLKSIQNVWKYITNNNKKKKLIELIY